MIIMIPHFSKDIQAVFKIKVILMILLFNKEIVLKIKRKKN